jgi:hypothetical protein
LPAGEPVIAQPRRRRIIARRTGKSPNSAQTGRRASASESWSDGTGAIFRRSNGCVGAFALGPESKAGLRRRQERGCEHANRRVAHAAARSNLHHVVNDPDRCSTAAAEAFLDIARTGPHNLANAAWRTGRLHRDPRC